MRTLGELSVGCASRSGGRGGPGAAPLRLTRRGRDVVAGASVVVGLALAAVVLLAGPGSPSAPSGLALTGSSSIVVESGDTLWSIAGEVAPDEDRRLVVDALLEQNGLDEVTVHPGQVLQLP